jgi:hypothetical protein
MKCPGAPVALSHWNPTESRVKLNSAKTFPNARDIVGIWNQQEGMSELADREKYDIRNS